MIANQPVTHTQEPCPRELRHVGVLSRCAEIVQNFRPGLQSVQRIDNDSVHVDVAHENGIPLSLDELGHLGRSLALQLGLQVRLSNNIDGSEHLLADFKMKGPPHTSSVVIDPTVYTAVLREPYSNIFEAVPPDILARIHARHVIQSLEPSTASLEVLGRVLVRAALKNFSIAMREVKLHSFGGFLNVLVDAAPDIVEQQEFYELTKELAKAAVGKSVVVTVAPRRVPVTETSQAVLPQTQAVERKTTPSITIVEESAAVRHAPEVLSFCAKLQEEVGTTVPYTVTFDHATQRCDIQILYKKNRLKIYEDLALRVEGLARDFNVPASVVLKYAARNSLILNEGKRHSVSHDELVKMAALLQAHLLCSDGSEWLRITPSSSSHTPVGNCIEVAPLIGLTDSLFGAIKRAATLIPAPILMHRIHTMQEPLSIEAIKSLTKLLLPGWASLHSIRELSSGKIVVRILSSRTSWFKLHQELTSAFKSVDPKLQKIAFEYSARPGKVCRALTERSDIYRKIFIRNMNGDGIIPIDTWKANLNKSRSLSKISYADLQDRYPSIIDRTDLTVSLWDVDGTSRAEDGQSFTIKDGVLTHGTHFANAAILLDQFSLERHRAYKRGDSLYVHDGDGAVVSHMLPGLGRHTFQTDVITPALSVFIDYKLDSLHDPAVVARSIANARLEATFIRPSSKYLYPREPSAEWSARLPRAAKGELALISEIGSALNRHSSGADIPSAKECPDPGSSIKHIIYLANHITAKILQDSKLPCLYQGTQIPSLDQLNRCLEAIKTYKTLPPELKKFTAYTAQDLADNPVLLHQLYSVGRTLPYSKWEKCNFPKFHSTLSMAPQSHLFSGYTPFVKANTGFRKLSSIIAQHQLNAYLGLVAPLSHGEINSIHLHHVHQQESGRTERIVKDLRIIALLRYLRESRAKPMYVFAMTTPCDGFVEVRAQLPFDASPRCVAAINPEEEARLRVGDTLRVVPAHYSLARNTLLFKRAD